MATFAEFSKNQQTVGDELQNAYTNYRKESKDRKSLDKLQSRLETISKVWEQFRSRHSQLMDAIEGNEDHPYLVNDYFNKIKPIFEDYMKRLQDDIKGIQRTQEGTSQIDPKANQETRSEGFTFQVKDSELPKRICLQEATISDLERLLASIDFEKNIQHSRAYYQHKMKSINEYWSNIASLDRQLLVEASEAAYNRNLIKKAEDHYHNVAIFLQEKIDEYGTTLVTPTNNVKLPKITLPIFDGNQIRWKQFMDLFTQLIHNQPLGSAEKMYYLKANLTGFIFDFISMPVIKAFSSATAIVVIESQIKVILGVKYIVPGFVNSIQTLAFKLDECRLGDALMGISSILFLISLKQLERIPFDESSCRGKFWKTFCSYMSLSRNALIVLITATVAFIWVSKSTDEVPFRLSEHVVPGLPGFSFPSFYIEANNRTYNFVQICSELGAGIFVIPLVSILTNISIAKALTPKGMVNASQELMTLGLCNIIGSGVQSMPTCGAFSRAAISAASGIKTSIAGLYSGILVIFALSLLTPYFHYIPESTLAAILICAIVTLIDIKLPIRLWHECKRDFFTWVSCFLVCIIFGVEVGLFFGIGITAAYLLYLWARPEIIVKLDQTDGMQYIRVTPNNGVYFPGIDHFRGKVLKACIAADFKVPVLIDGRKITGIDYSAAQGISKLGNDLDEGGRAQALIMHHLHINFQKMIDTGNNIFFTETEERLKEILTQVSLRNGVISLKDHVRASIDLGYKIDP